MATVTHLPASRSVSSPPATPSPGSSLKVLEQALEVVRRQQHVAVELGDVGELAPAGQVEAPVVDTGDSAQGQGITTIDRIRRRHRGHAQPADLAGEPTQHCRGVVRRVVVHDQPQVGTAGLLLDRRHHRLEVFGLVAHGRDDQQALNRFHRVG